MLDPELPADSDLDHNRLVRVRARCLLSWDGDPATDGSEYYAPPGWQPDSNQTVDAEGRSLLDLPSEFETTQMVADQLVKAGVVEIVSGAF